MIGRADRQAVLPRSQAAGRLEVELWAGGVNQELISEFLALTRFAFDGPFEFDARLRLAFRAFRVKGHRLRLLEVDSMSGVDRRQRELVTFSLRH